MMFKVLDTLVLNGNTVVTINGNGEGLKNGVYVKNAQGVNFQIISIGTVRRCHEGFKQTTELLIDGLFSGDEITLSK